MDHSQSVAQTKCFTWNSGWELSDSFSLQSDSHFGASRREAAPDEAWLLAEGVSGASAAPHSPVSCPPPGSSSRTTPVNLLHA